MTPAGLTLTLMTDDVALARRADSAGVDRIGPDLEWRGKTARQGRRSGSHRISDHRSDAVAQIAGVLTRAQAFVRVNGPHPGTRDEVDRVVDAGATVVMLPAFHDIESLTKVSTHLRGRATLVPLVETVEAASRIEEVVTVPGIDEIHIGLNDLRLSMGGDGTGRLELLVHPLVEHVVAVAHAAGLRVGVAGVADPGDTTLPVPAHLVYGALARLRIDGTLLARSFPTGPLQLADGVRAARDTYAALLQRSDEQLEAAGEALSRHLAAHANP